jgi:hypothetical protein
MYVCYNAYLNGKNCVVYRILTGKRGRKEPFGKAGVKLIGSMTCREL